MVSISKDYEERMRGESIIIPTFGVYRIKCYYSSFFKWLFSFNFDSYFLIMRNLVNLQGKDQLMEVYDMKGNFANRDTTFTQ